MANESEIAMSAAAPANGGRAVFVIDSKRSRFTVQAFATGVLSAMGHNPTIGISIFSGEATFAPETPEACGLRLTIQAASLAVQDDISDKDRREIDRVMKADVLETEKYPEIRYEASSVSISKIDGSLYFATLNGSLSLHGITRAAPVPVRIVSLVDMLRASGDFTLKQSDYQIKPVSVAGGALKLKDELKLSFEMIAKKIDASA